MRLHPILIVFIAIFAVRHSEGHEELTCDSSKLVFSTPDGFRLLDIDSLAVEALPHGHLIDSMPMWSPDGTRIAFTSQNDDSGWDLYVMNHDGRNLMHKDGGLSISPNLRWSPDGNWLAYNSSGQIFITHTLRNEQQQLTTDSSIKFFEGWSPDNTGLVLSVSALGSKSLQLVDIATQTVQALTDRQPQVYDYFVSWTPDGNILFNSNRAGHSLTLHQLDMLTGTITEHMPRFISSLVWTSNNTAFVFMSSENIGHPNRSAQNIFVTEWGTAQTTQITQDGEVDHENYFHPGLSPDDQRIVFESWEDEDYELFVIDLDGQDYRQLTFNEHHDINPKWVPCLSPQ